MNLSKVSMSIMLSNENDPARDYTVGGSVNVNNTGALTNIESGFVNSLNGENKAYFNVNADSSININFYNDIKSAEERFSVYKTIEAFIADAKVYIAEL